MATLIKTEKISLKGHPEINEAAIQKFIFDDPSVLGLGNLISIRREKIQPTGGRLDILLSDPEGTDRFEVEIQLGSTDPSHIIRTIEYWDTEKKRYPKYNHCAVIVAEEITGRFMNVISLFNGAIPLIALQMSAVKHNDDIELVFTKVLDCVNVGDEEEIAEATDRIYWEKNSTPQVLKCVDCIFNDLGEITSGFELKYNKFYIGIAKNGVAKNFVEFKPQKHSLKLYFKGAEDQEKLSRLEDAGLEVSYNPRFKRYEIRIDNYDHYEMHKDLIKEMIQSSKMYYGVDNE